MKNEFGRVVDDSEKPTTWEKFLNSHGLTHRECLEKLRSGCSSLRNWVRSNYIFRYIPEDILAAAGLKQSSDWRW